MENYDQRLIQDSRAFDFADDDDEFDFEQCMPIVCEEDDEPDFTIMNKKTEKAKKNASNNKAEVVLANDLLQGGVPRVYGGVWVDK